MGGIGMRSGSSGGGGSTAYNDGWESSRRGADDRNWSMFFIYNCRVYSINTNVYVDLDSDYRSRDSYEDESQYDGEREDSDNESPHAPRLVVFPF